MHCYRKWGLEAIFVASDEKQVNFLWVNIGAAFNECVDRVNKCLHNDRSLSLRGGLI